MMTRVLILGGYGNFGSFIAKTLAKENGIQVIIAGRSQEKAEQYAGQIGAQAIALDITKELVESLVQINPDIVIHTSGPFQSQGHDVAEACINHGCHYIDLADGRDFVAGISSYDAEAREKNILVVSGASSVPCLTSALVDHYLPEFETIESLNYGITTAQKTARGLATTAAILGYTGKPFKTLIDGKKRQIYGWKSLRARKYWGLGWRLLGNCDIPDLALFPERYPSLKTVRFYAGLELSVVHLGLWALSWLVRIGLVRRLEKAAPTLLRLSILFDRFGSADSGFHMTIAGIGKNHAPKTLSFELVARSGDGPYIPCIPSILLTKKIATGQMTKTGAMACMGLITLEEYLGALKDLDIQWRCVD